MSDWHQSVIIWNATKKCYSNAVIEYNFESLLLEIWIVNLHEFVYAVFKKKNKSDSAN